MNYVENIEKKVEEVFEGCILKKEMITRQIGSNEDHVAMGTYIDEGIRTDWLAVFDGHGTDCVIDAIRNANLNEIMKEPFPYDKLQQIAIEACELSTDLNRKYKSGSTCIYAKVIYSPNNTRIEITNIGDSRAILFVNGAPIFISTAHDYNNASDILRLIKEKRVDEDRPVVNMKSNFEVLSPKKILLKGGKYINFIIPNEKRITLSPSQSLGHMGICGLAPDTSTFHVKPMDEFKLFLFSDGVSDMIPVEGVSLPNSMRVYQYATSAFDIVDEAERRWKQEWIYYKTTDMKPNITTKFPSDGYDDCCCVMIDRAKAIIEIDGIVVNGQHI
jgi:serine/threonine protein phosphatase PrpC